MSVGENCGCVLDFLFATRYFLVCTIDVWGLGRVTTKGVVMTCLGSVMSVCP